MSKKPLIIYFDNNGNLQDQAYGYQSSKSEEAKDFDDEMIFERIYDFNRRSCRAYLKSTTTGRTYSMFIEDFGKVLKANRFNDMHIKGTWKFIKSGVGQAIQLILPKDMP